MEKVMNDVDPNDLRFTQKWVSPAFKSPYQGVFLEDAIAQIRRKDMTVSTFPKLQVIKHENTLWCLNNRRLFVFRKAGVDKIDVQISRFPMHPRLSVVLENAEDKIKMRKKKFFPSVKKYKDGTGVHTNPPPPGFPPIPPQQADNHPPTRSIHHGRPNFNVVVGQPGQHHPCSHPMQYLQNYSRLDSMQVARLPYFGQEARWILPNATKYNQLQGSAETMSTRIAIVQEDQIVQIDPARNSGVRVCAPPPPIVTSPRPRGTPKCSLSQVPSGQIVCVYIKAERIASRMTKSLTKPNVCRDTKLVCSGQDSKGKAAVAGKEESSRLPSNNPSASRFPSLETHFWKVKADSISQRMGNPTAPPEQPKHVPTAKIHASTDLVDNHLINLESVPSRSCKYYATVGPTISSDRSRSETRMEPRIAPSVGESKPDSILQGIGKLGAPPKPLKPVTRVTDASLDRQPINLGTIPNEELPDKRMNARILAIDDKRVGLLGILSTPADHRNECVVDMPPSSDLEPLLRHVPATNISRISSRVHPQTTIPPRYNSACWGFMISLAKKLGRHRRPPSASAAASNLYVLLTFAEVELLTFFFYAIRITT